MGAKQFFRNLIFEKDERSSIEERSGEVFTLLNNAFKRFWLGVDGGDVDCSVTSLSAMRVSTVFTCVLVRAESLSTLPASVKQSTENGSRTAYEHPVHRLIHDKPNPFQTAADFWKTASAHIDLFGNCFAIITYSGSMRPKRLDIIEYPNEVQIMKTETGECYYDYNGKRYNDYEMLHFKDLSLDGYYGCSRIKYNSETIGYSKKLKNFGKNSVSTKPPG